MQDQTGTPLTAPAAAPAPADPTTARRVGLVAATAALTFLIDQGTKIWALHSLPSDGLARPLIGDVISLRLVRNPGAAFSSLDGMTIVVTLVALVIVGGLAYYVHSRRITRPIAVCLGLIAGGALGNLLDRFVREPGFLRGHVVDFIDYFGWFVGNVADIAIVLAALAFLLLSWRAEPRDV